jgi:hypothetical protein
MEQEVPLSLESNMMSPRILPSLLRAVPLLAFAGALAAQTPAVDPIARLREVLPTDVADRVIAQIEQARARQLPAQALENRALKFAARGIAPAELEQAVSEHAVRLVNAQAALRSARPGVSGVEVEAGAEAMRQGVDGAAVSALAQSAPSGRSLEVPLYVIGNLVERGLPADEALERVRERLMQRASDADLERMPAGVAGAGARGLERAGAAGRPAGTPPTGAPAGVPANGGKANAPTQRPPVIPPIGTPPTGSGRP